MTSLAFQALPNGDDGLLACLGSVEGAHALIVARHGLDLLSGLIRGGCIAAACVRPYVRTAAGAHDLVILAAIAADTDIDRLVHQGRRAIVQGGRLIAGIGPDPSGRIARGLVRRLKLQGFASVRVLAGGCVVQAMLVRSVA
jgi:hypothetical protein